MPVRPDAMRLALPCLAVTLLLPASGVYAQQQSLAAVSWFQGCWERTLPNDRRTVERWHAPAGNELKGDSRSFAGAVETGGERLRISVDGGTLVYHAHPSTQLPQTFRAKTVSATEIVFENLEHDFPQRIVYVRQGKDSLIARIEGDRAGRRQPVTFPFRSIGCAGQEESPSNVAEDALRPAYADLTTRLRAHPQGTAAWFVQHAAPEFTYLNFAAPGYQGRAGGLRTQEAAARVVAGAPAPTLTDYSVNVAIASLLARGDTTDVMVVISQSARTGAAGQLRLRSTEQRRLDRWVKRGGTWKLAQATVVDDENFLDGVLNARNGVPVAPRP
jgi:hypothetical protein